MVKRVGEARWERLQRPVQGPWELSGGGEQSSQQPEVGYLHGNLRCREQLYFFLFAAPHLGTGWWVHSHTMLVPSTSCACGPRYGALLAFCGTNSFKLLMTLWLAAKTIMVCILWMENSGPERLEDSSKFMNPGSLAQVLF